MIRELTKDDKDIFISMVKEFYTSDAVLYSIPEENIVNTFNEAIKDSPYVKIYMMEEEKGIAGYGQISLSYSNEAGGLVVWLEEIYIREDFRGLGLGGKFLDFVKNEFSADAKRFRLEISESNMDAKRLYIRNGYETLDYLQMVCDIK